MASDAIESSLQNSQLSGSGLSSTSSASVSASNQQQQQQSQHQTTGSASFPVPSTMPDPATFEELTTQFHTIHVNDTRFEILKRYENLRIVGSGAQGVVW